MTIGTGTVGRVAVEFGLDYSAFDTGLRLVEDRVRSALGNIGNMSQRLDRALTTIGKRLTVGITLPIAGTGVALAKLGADFDQTMTRIETLAGATAGEVEEFRAAVLRLSPALGQTPTALSEALLAITSRGPRGAQALDVLERAAKASTVGLGETAVVAGLVSSALAAYGPTGLTAARATDVLLAAVRAGAAEADEMAGAMGNVIAVASQVGVSFEEVSAFVATFTKLGVNADEAVTALRGTLNTVLAPSAGAEEALRGVGLSSEELRRQIKERGLTEAFIGLVDTFRGNEQGLANIIENVRALSGVMGTAGAQASTYRQVLGEVTNSTGVLDRAFARTTQTPAYTFRQFRVEAIATATALGDRLAPAFASLLRAASPLINLGGALVRAFTALPTPIQTTALALVAMAAATGPLILLLLGAAKAVVALGAAVFLLKLGPVLLSLARAAAPAVRGITSLRAVVAALPSPISAAASAALGLFTALHPLGLLIGPVAALAARLVSMHPTMRILGLVAIGLATAIGGIGITTKGLASASSSASTNLSTMADRIEDVGKRAAEAKGLIQSLNEEAARSAGADIGPQAAPTPLPTSIPVPPGGLATPSGTPVPGTATPTPTPPPVPLPLGALGGTPPPAGQPGGRPTSTAALAGAAAAVGSDNADVAKIFREARAEILGLETAAKLLPPTFDLAGAKAGVIETALKSAAQAGLKDTSEEGRALAAQLQGLAGDTTQFDRGMAAISAQAGLTGDAMGAWQQQISALQSQIAQFRADGLEGAAVALEQRLYDLIDVGPPVEAELGRLAAQGEAVGPSFDTAGRSITFLRGAIESLVSQGVAPGSDVIRLMQQGITRLSGDTTGLAAKLNAATRTGDIFGDSQDALRDQVREVEGALRSMILSLEQQTAVLGAADPEVVKLAGEVEKLAAVWRQLDADFKQQDGLTKAREALKGYSEELRAIGERAAILRGAGLEGGDPVSELQARATAGRNRIDTLTALPTPATPEGVAQRQAEIQQVVVDVQGAERSIRVAGAIQGAFETAADGVASAFDRSVLGIIQGTQTIGQAAAQMGQSIALELASSAVKGVTSWAAGQAQILAIEAATQAGLISASTTGAGIREGIAGAEALAVGTAKGGEVTAHALAEAAKTGATAAGSGTRQGLTLAEIGTSIAAKAVEVAAWVAGEGAKLAASVATFIVSIAGTLRMVAATIAMGAALAIALVSMIALSIITPIFATIAAASSAGILTLASALKAVAIAGAASAVADIPYIGPILAVAAASTVASTISSLAAVPVITAARGAYLSQDQVVQAHARESILPAVFTSGLRDLFEVVPQLAALNEALVTGGVPSLQFQRGGDARSAFRAGEGGAASGGSEPAPVFAPRVEINAVDDRSVRRLFSRHGSELTEALEDQFRSFNQRLRRKR